MARRTPDRQTFIRARKALQDARAVLAEMGYLTPMLEKELDRIDSSLLGERPAKKEKWSGNVYAPTAAAGPIVTPEGDVVVGTSSAREQRLYAQTIAVLSAAVRALIREQRRYCSPAESRYAIRGAALYIAGGVPRLMEEALNPDGVRPVVPRQEMVDERVFTFAEQPEQPEQPAPGTPVPMRAPRG